jgi:hypothetical protein
MGARGARVGRAAHRTTAALAAAVLVLAWIAPLAAAFADDGPPGCCRGRCCCRPPAADTRCVSASCPCGDERRALEPLAPLPEAVLPEAGALPRTAGEADLASRAAASPHRLALPVPHPPPKTVPPRSTDAVA